MSIADQNHVQVRGRYTRIATLRRSASPRAMATAGLYVASKVPKRRARPAGHNLHRGTFLLMARIPIGSDRTAGDSRVWSVG